LKLKIRLEKLEEKLLKKDEDNNGVVFYIDDKCTYKGKEYTREEFEATYPKFKNIINVVWVE
jgi:hypothetical protein